MSILTANATAVTAAPIATPAQDLVTGMEWSPAQIGELYCLASEVKLHPDGFRGALRGRSVAMIFEKPSLRTRVTFEVGVQNLGGTVVFLDHTASPLGRRESVKDVGRNLERWVHAIVARTVEQQVLEELAEHAAIPIINGLSNRFHPCQALADFFTLEEHFGGLRGLRLAYVGDGNNVCHSLLVTGARVGAHLRVATPAGYEPDPEVVADARRAARKGGGKIELLRDPQEAVSGAQAVYTDVWVSMGDEHEAAERHSALAAYQVNETLMELAAPGAVFLHCLPAHRGMEVTDAVVDAAYSLVYAQAENRLHVQNALLLTLLAQ
jgi:ornithine carbamoyltransferase